MTSLDRALRLAGISAFAVMALSAAPMAQGGGRGRGGMSGMMGDESHMADMELIHTLLDNGSKVRRTVTMRPDGVETVTESDDPALVDTIRAHVAAMYGRVKEQKPIHMRDPLFRAVFENASKIEMTHAVTDKGVRVTETSTDPYVVKLIQAHARVVDAFVKNGRAEAMKNHDLPPK